MEAIRAARASQTWTKVEKTLRYHGHASLRWVRGLLWNLRHPAAQSPVFVIGCSRAGTTLVYRTFCEAPELGCLRRETHEVWAELHPLEEKQWRSHRLEAEDASRRDRDFVTRYFYTYTGCLRFVDKNNQNGLCVPYLHALFPDARFVYVKRSPGDNILSLIEGWRRPERFGTWSEDLPAKVTIDGGQYRRWCFFLPDGWRDYCDSTIEEVCALQYREMNNAILSARKGVPQEQWTEIFYEKILDDPVGTFLEAFQSVGTTFDRHVEEHCRTVLSNPYNAFSEVRKEKWKDSPNAARIKRVLPAVSDVAAAMGY